MRREIRNLVGWPRFVITADDHQHELFFLRDGVKLLRNFGTTTTVLADYPVFPVPSLTSATTTFASLEYRVKYQEDKVSSSSLRYYIFTFFISKYFFCSKGY